ncbi:MAG: HAD family acid phosphatase [Pseudolabrys sp.]
MRIARFASSRSDVFRILLASFVAAFLAAGAAFAQPAIEARRAQPPNLDELKQQLLAYHKSGDYERQLAAVAARAQAFIAQHAGEVSRPALVLDIDETSLSNWPRIVADDFGYISSGACNRLPKGPCGAKAWELMAKAPVIEQTLKLFNAARAKGVSVFFITGRDESERAATIRSLHRTGYRGWTRLVMKPVDLKVKSAADFKAPERAKIAAAGYTIIANMGDQPSDLAGGNPDDRAGQFLLPDPFYRIP